MPYYDQWGWYSEDLIADRFTDVAIPENIPEGHAANWTGHGWAVLPYVAPIIYTPPANPNLVTKMTKLAFRKRFTQAEKVAIEIASLDNPADTMEQRSLSAALRAYQQDLVVAQYIDTTDTALIAGIQQLEAVGLIAADRGSEILNTPISDIEAFIE